MNNIDNNLSSNHAAVKIIPLGGLEQIGMNITAIEYEDDIIVIDGGLAFPDDDMPGIDLVIPDITYLKENKNKIRGNLYPADEYNGCPYCKSVCFVQCTRCGKLSCWNNEERISCAWCGLTGDVSRIEDEVDVKGGDY